MRSSLAMATVARKNINGGSSAATTKAVLAGVLALSHLFLLAGACGSAYCPSPRPPPAPAPCSPTPTTPSGTGKCPVNALKLEACASLLGGLVSLELGQQQASSSSSSSIISSKNNKKQPCCELLGGLADVDAAVCLCTALRANVLGLVQLSVPLQLSLLVNSCGKKLPQGFQCPR